MKNKITEALATVHPKYRVRYIKKSIELSKLCEKLYPNANLNIVVYCLFHGGTPYCVVCNNPLVFQGKKTCSSTCRTLEQSDRIAGIVEKRKETFLLKYGVENAAQISEIQEKRLASLFEKHGSYVSPKTREAAIGRIDNLNTKGRITLQEKYGVSNPGQLPGHSVKCKQTLLKNYGVDNYYKSEEFLDKSSKQRYQKWTCTFPDYIELLNIAENSNKQQLFENPNIELEFNCTRCNTLDKVPTETAKWRIRNTGTPCINCSGISHGSAKQLKISEFIQSFDVNIISNFKLLNNTQVDIYCPDYNMGFEFDGLYWHNDLRKDKKYHITKTNVAKEQGITLIHIFEDEWEHNEDIVKSRIKNLLKISSIKIFARKCEIKEVDKITEKSFLINNHIQGYANSKVAIGLYHNDILVSLMSFSKPNRAKGQQLIDGHWELLRYCSLLDHSVIGGASRIFSKFIQIYDPIQVLSFADKRWSIGNLYKELGFDQHKDTAINYWYINIKKVSRIYRYKLRKTKEDIQELSEYENRLQQGYLRIWDCGHCKFIWTKKSSQ